MSKIKIFLNGEERFFEKMSIRDLILELGIDVGKIAIEKDLEVVSFDKFDQVMIDEGSRIEIVHFIGGG